MLLVSFAKEAVHVLPMIGSASTGMIIVSILAFVDLVMVANLILLIIFAGYENFVSKISTSDSEDRPDWMGVVTFSDLKMKLIGSIIAISAVELLRTFISVNDRSGGEIGWKMLLHLTFVTSGVLFALMDRLATKKSSP
jgi:uncharacterized protein (TIGR00645 family)